MMDYDGANQHAVTHLGTISMSPRVSPDNSRLAFASLGKYGFQLKMYSLLLGRYVSFPSGAGSTRISRLGAQRQRDLPTAAAPEGSFDIWIADSNGNLGRRITNFTRRQRLAHLQPQDRRADRLHQRPHRPASALHHELRRLRRAADDRRRLCLLALLVAQRPVHRLRLGPQVRPRRARRPGHLHHGGCHQEMVAAHPRWRPLRLPHLVARRPPHRLRQLRRRPRRPHAHLVHARATAPRGAHSPAPAPTCRTGAGNSSPTLRRR